MLHNCLAINNYEFGELTCKYVLGSHDRGEDIQRALEAVERAIRANADQSKITNCEQAT